MTSASTCPDCGGAGYYLLAVPYGHPLWATPQPCRCRAGQPSPAQVRQAERLRAELGEFAGKTFANFDPDWPTDPVTIEGQTFSAKSQRGQLAAALKTARTYADRLTGWLYIFGTYGGGKSHLAAAILNACAERGIVGAYASASELLRHIHDGWADNTASARLATLATMPLLVVDELKDEYLAGGVKTETLWELLNPRYRDNRPTVITSNVYRDDLPDRRLSDRIAERVNQGGAEIILTVGSHRQIGGAR